MRVTWQLLLFLSNFGPAGPSSFHPKMKFGAKGEEKTFWAEWCQENDWLHYDIGKDAAFCYLCMKCEHKKKFLSSKKWEPAFIYNGYILEGSYHSFQKASDQWLPSWSCGSITCASTVHQRYSRVTGCRTCCSESIQPSRVHDCTE